MLYFILRRLGDAILLYYIFLVIYIFRNKLYRVKTLFPFILYIIAGFSVELVMNIMQKLGYRNVFLQNYMIVLQFGILSYYFQNFLKNKIIKYSVLTVTGVIITGIIYAYFQISDTYLFNSFRFFSTYPFIIFYALYICFLSISNKKMNELIYINSAILIYFSCSLIIFFSYKTFIELNQNDSLILILMINNIIYLSFLTAVFYNFRQLRESYKEILEPKHLLDN